MYDFCNFYIFKKTTNLVHRRYARLRYWSKQSQAIQRLMTSVNYGRKSHAVLETETGNDLVKNKNVTSQVSRATWFVKRLSFLGNRKLCGLPNLSEYISFKPNPADDWNYYTTITNSSNLWSALLNRHCVICYLAPGVQCVFKITTLSVH